MNSDESSGDVDRGVDPEAKGELLPAFERKYKDQMRQIVTQRLDLPISTLPMMLKDQIKIDPDFQRRDRWDENQQSRFIESLLMNVPIPPVFLGEDEYGSYVVLDGRQRLTAVRNFLNNSLKLKNLSVWDDLNGRTYEDLVKRNLDKHLTRRFIPAIVLLKESSPIVKYDVFERLNTGGVRANDMEIRHAVFRGGFTDLLRAMSRRPAFCDLWGIPQDLVEAEAHSMYQKMDDLLAALRFFALREPAFMEGPFRDYLSDFMQGRNEAYSKHPELAAADASLFDRALTNTVSALGVDAFRNVWKDPKATRSMPLADAVMIGMSEVTPEDIPKKGAQAYQSALKALCENGVFSKAITSGTNGKSAIQTRVNMAKVAFTSV